MLSRLKLNWRWAPAPSCSRQGLLAQKDSKYCLAEYSWLGWVWDYFYKMGGFNFQWILSFPGGQNVYVGRTKSGNRRGNQGYEQMVIWAFSFLLCFTVIDGHGLPPITWIMMMKDYSFSGSMCQALCCGLVLLRTLSVACYGKTNSSLLGGKAEIHWTCTWKIQVLVLGMTGSCLSTVFLWVVSFGTATSGTYQEATSCFRPHLTSSPTTEERGWMAVIVLRCFLTYIFPVGILFFSSL